jgi:3-isopropylmalate/(R)-2-methylmalate dehydratase small subunit
MQDAENGANAVFAIDLAAQTINRPNGETIGFEIDSFRKHCLLNGLDDIGLTLEKQDSIAAYETRVGASQPWASVRLS